jgi:hypothetical protein
MRRTSITARCKIRGIQIEAGSCSVIANPTSPKISLIKKRPERFLVSTILKLKKHLRPFFMKNVIKKFTFEDVA